MACTFPLRNVLSLSTPAPVPEMPTLVSTAGIAGLSMGGVHACMTAGLYQAPVACTPLLAPRSAAVAYCDGAMHAAMAWDPLTKELRENDGAIGQVWGEVWESVGVTEVWAKCGGG